MLGLSLVSFAALGTACGGDSSTDDGLGSPPTTATPRRPGGGPSSGNVVGGSSSSGRSGSSSSGGRSSSSGDASSSSSSSGGSGSSSGESSSSGEPACVDDDDAPDFEEAAAFTPVTANGSTFDAAGVLDGQFDVDWYAYDITGSPTTVVYVEENLPVEVCVYYQCKAGTLSVTCKPGSIAATDDDGNQGCCATGNATTRASVGTTMFCNSAPDDSFTTVSVTSLEEQCADYTTKIKF